MGPLTGWPEPVAPSLRVVIPAARGMGTAVDMQRLPGQVDRHVRGEKHCDTGNLVDVAGTAQRYDVPHAVHRCISVSCASPSVSVISGAIALTRMPWGASSSAAVLV